MAKEPRPELHAANIDTRSRLVVPIAVLRKVSWAAEIKAAAAVTFELMDDEGLVRILRGAEYEARLTAAHVDEDFDAVAALELILVPHAFDKEVRLTSIPGQVVLHLLERRQPPAGVYVRVRGSAIELWSQDRALRELRNARFVAAKRLPD